MILFPSRGLVRKGIDNMHNGQSDLLELLSNASESTIDEIIRQAETYLTAQLAAGIAADQRAITFTGMLATAVSLLGGGALVVGVGNSKDLPTGLAVACLPAILGFLGAMWLTMQASKPVDWHYVGNTPSNWLKDLRQAKSLLVSKAEQAKHYAESIEANNLVLETQAKSVSRAIKVSWFGLVGSAIATGLIA